MVWRRRWTPLGVAALFVAAALTACDSSQTAQFRGTTLSAANRAADFALTDQFGEQVSLSDHGGDVVVLTFLYTYCPDICPVVASHLTEVHEALSGDGAAGGGMDGVSIVAVSVDPERDTVERAHQYSSQYGMLDGWSYLIGEESVLKGVWADYFVSPAPRGDGLLEADPRNADGSSDTLFDQIVATYTVDHQAPVYLIDGEGRMRVVFTLPFSPEDVAADVRTLLDE